MYLNHSRFSKHLMLPVACIFMFIACSGDKHTSSQSTALGGTTILSSSSTALGETTILWEGKIGSLTDPRTEPITIKTGETLKIINSQVYFKPPSEDTTMIYVNGGKLIVENSTIDSTGKQWNLEATGSSELSFTNSTATKHTGIRANDSTKVTVDASNIGEVQCHDNATINIINGSEAYLVLFFNNTGSVSLTSGELYTDQNTMTRAFTFKSTSQPVSSICGTINISKSIITGFQLDIIGNTKLIIDNGAELVLALHLQNVGTITVPQNITSMTSGTIDFSASGGPSINFTNSVINYINIYVSGTSDVTFSGTIKVIEANVMDSAKLTFGSGTSIICDLLQAYDYSNLTLNGCTLITDGSTIPSITASGTSTIIMNNVNAITGTIVYAENSGRVTIYGGTGWDETMFEFTSPALVEHI
jgi:hypothetical protein